LTHLRGWASALGRPFAQFLGTIIVLPHEAYVSADAMVRTMTRMLWTKTRMLEWKTSGDANRGQDLDLPGFLRTMWFGPALGAAVSVSLVLIQPAMLLIAGPVLGLWL